MSIVSYRDLYQQITENDAEPVDAQLARVLPSARELMKPLERHRRFRDAPIPLPNEEAWELWEFYALSRVNDYLLLPFQSGEPGADEVERVTERSFPRVSETIEIRPGTPEWEQFGSRSTPMPGTEYVTDAQITTLSLDVYLQFFSELGFVSFGDEIAYSPFYHEIVEVLEDPDAHERIQIAAVLWPGLMFGEMLFSRAGVRVRCRPGVMDKASAERSTLYFAFRRRLRPTHDQSMGWGHNSQWRTAFHRFYDDGQHLHFNVVGTSFADGIIDLSVSELPPSPEDPQEHLSLDQRRELLVHRSVVSGWTSNDDCYPYDDSWTVPKSETPWPT